MIRRRPLTATVAALAAVVATACGSTFPVDPVTGEPVAAGGVPTQQQGAEADSGLGLASPSADGNAGADAGSGLASGSAATGTSGGSSATTPSAPTSASGSNGDTDPSNRPATTSDGLRPFAPGSPGIDDEKILVGLTYTEDSAAANSALGAGGITTGDARRNYAALLDYFNERGGAGGREIVPVYHKYEATSSQPYATQEEAACTTFTQDQPVFVSLAGGLPAISDGTFNACMHAAGTPILAAGAQSDQNDDSFARWPEFVQGPTLSLDAVARLWPTALDENGYFEPRGALGETLVGVVTYDTAVMRTTYERSLEPALAALGHQVEDVAYVRQPDSFTDVSDMSAEIQSAVLQFNSQGIQHVLIQDAGNALLTLLFMTSAENQSYRPRYGLTTNNGGQLIVGTAPEAQFAEARLLGWLPSVDVPASSFDESMGGGRELCDAIYADAGITHADSNAALVAWGQCDQIRSLVAAVDAGSGQLSQPTFIEDWVSIGTGFESSIVGPTRFAPARHYGVARYRGAEFSGDCTCFQYVTPWRKAP